MIRKRNIFAYLLTTSRGDGTRIALVTFGTEAKLEFNLGDSEVDTRNKVINAISKVKYSGGATASTFALRLVRTVVVPNARDDSKRAMIFITDGKSNVGGPPKKEAAILKEKEKFEIYAVGEYFLFFVNEVLSLKIERLAAALL